MGPGKIYFDNLPFAVQGEVAHGGKVVEVGVPVPGLGDGLLGPLQFFILHLQSNLAHFQFEHQALNIRRGDVVKCAALGRQELLNAKPQIVPGAGC